MVVQAVVETITIPLTSICPNGLPVFSLSDTQVQNLTNGAQPAGGNFAVEIFFDPITSYEIRQLVAAVMTGGNWTKELDPFSNSPIITDIDPSTYPHHGNH